MEEKIKHDTKIKATWRERECPVSVGLSGQGGLQPPSHTHTHPHDPHDLVREGGKVMVGFEEPEPKRKLPLKSGSG